MTQIAVDLPSDFVEMETADAIEHEMRVAYALALFVSFRQGCMNTDRWSGRVEAPRTWRTGACGGVRLGT